MLRTTGNLPYSGVVVNDSHVIDYPGGDLRGIIQEPGSFSLVSLHVPGILRTRTNIYQ